MNIPSESHPGPSPRYEQWASSPQPSPPKEEREPPRACVNQMRVRSSGELLKTHGKLEGKALQAAFRDLTAIYHAKHAHSMPIRPPQIGDTDAK